MGVCHKQHGFACPAHGCGALGWEAALARQCLEALGFLFCPQGDEQRLYELIVRHFLACCSQDAQGQETTVEIDIAQERFVAHGLMILARNYLDVYPYDRWSDKVTRLGGGPSYSWLRDQVG